MMERGSSQEDANASRLHQRNPGITAKEAETIQTSSKLQ
jgi:hypothetical protein